MPRTLVKTVIVVWTRAEPPGDDIAGAVESLRAVLDARHLDHVVFSNEPEIVDDVNLQDDPNWDTECAACFEDGPSD